MSSRMYGVLFKDGGIADDYCLFVDRLSMGVSCQVQLIHRTGTGEFRVRKVLHRRPRKHDRRPNKIQAELQFDQDVEVARFLSAEAAKRGIDLRIPKLISDYTTPDEYWRKSGKYSRVSYWSLCNGGSLDAFVEDCLERGETIPRGMAFRFLRQILETLQAMYAQCSNPVFHGDMHANNVLLHFEPQCTVPDFYLVDFGQASFVSPSVPAVDGERGNWDIPDLMKIIEDRLFMPSLPLAGLDAMHHWEGVISLLRDGATTDPLYVAYQMLRGLDKVFNQNKRVALRTQQPVVIPDLTPVINYVRDRAMLMLPELILHCDWRTRNEAYCKTYGNPSSPEPTKQLPLLLPESEAVLHVRNVPGPWYLAQVDPKTFTKIGVNFSDPKHRPNEENENSDTDSAWCSDEELP
ncbi:hypothetical protein MFIFM68171_10068 [Madurella fahalii]|uniref:Protein kinase domain-containing protein n=1 Tax=Madurella fahalii TaxID=1157608 RepID=A0ABQ0GQ35_9PEZI